jgi:hypothetical protein
MTEGRKGSGSSGAAPGESSATGGTSPSALPHLVMELRDLVVTYVRQETLVPLRQLGRYVAFGIVGSVLLGVGVVLLGVGVLRLLQTEAADTFDGDWSWGPYGIVVALWVFAAVVVWKARGARRRRRKGKS